MPPDDIGQDIGDDIRATMAQLNAGETITGPPEVVETPAAEAVEAAPVVDRDDGRDDKGRFKAKDEAVAEAGSKPVTQQSAEAAATGTEPVAPPAKWEPHAKAAFMAAPPDVQKQILAQVEATEKANADWQPKAQTFAMIEQVIAPQREAWARNGMSEAQAIAGLVSAQQMLDQDPISGLVKIAQSYGLTREDWLAAAGVGPDQGEGQAQQSAPAQDPRINALYQQVQTLTQTLTQQQQKEQHQAQQTIQQQIEDFARDPKHLYFENVKPLMAALMKSGQAQDLPTAYGMATRAHPEVSKLVFAQESKAKAEADKAALAAKKNAGVSVVGSPGQRGKAVSSDDQPGGSTLSQTDEIRAAARKAMAELRAS